MWRCLCEYCEQHLVSPVILNPERATGAPTRDWHERQQLTTHSPSDPGVFGAQPRISRRKHGLLSHQRNTVTSHPPSDITPYSDGMSPQLHGQPLPHISVERLFRRHRSSRYVVSLGAACRQTQSGTAWPGSARSRCSRAAWPERRCARGTGLAPIKQVKQSVNAGFRSSNSAP